MFIFLICGGYVLVVDMLLCWDGDVNLVGLMGNIFLYYVCSEGYIECCYILLVVGVNINVKNFCMDILLIVVVVNGYFGIV